MPIDPWSVGVSERIAKAIARDEAIKELCALLIECADDIEETARAEHPAETRAAYPDAQRRYQRDTELARRARQAAEMHGGGNV